MTFASYPKIWNLGHPKLESLFKGEVLVEEKVDGSQFNFWVAEDGVLRFRSKGAEIEPDSGNKLFLPATSYITSIKDRLKKSWIYRGETLCKPKHNTLAYTRIPNNNIMLFDIDDGQQNYLGWEEVKWEANLLEVDTVPLLYRGSETNLESLKGYLEQESYLGGTKLEGVVVKNYRQFGEDAKALMGKYVSEAFKEKHNKDWKNRNPGQKDFLQNIVDIYRHENRWLKAIQHLREQGILKESPEDIGPLMKEVVQDILQEEKGNIAEMLWKFAWPQMHKGFTRGLAEWYKQTLLDKQNFKG